MCVCRYSHLFFNDKNNENDITVLSKILRLLFSPYSYFSIIYFFQYVGENIKNENNSEQICNQGTFCKCSLVRLREHTVLQ